MAVAAFALCDFFEEGSVEIVACSMIDDVDSVNIGEECNVNWPCKKRKGVTKHKARIIQFGESRLEMKDILEEYLANGEVEPVPRNERGRGHRQKKTKKLSESEDEQDVETPPPRPAIKDKARDHAHELLQKIISQQGHQDRDRSLVSGNDEDRARPNYSNWGRRGLIERVSTLEWELRESKKMIASLTQQLEATEALPGLILELRGVVKQLTRTPTGQQPVAGPLDRGVAMPVPLAAPVAPPALPTQAVQASIEAYTPREGSDVVQVGGGLELPLSCLDNMKKKDARHFCMEIMTAVFSREEMAKHSLTGKNTAKPELSPEKIDAVIGFVRKAFPGTTVHVVRDAIKTKLANEAKLFKK